MQTSAAGNKPCPGRKLRGFTLLELLVVVTLLGLVSAGVVLSMRDAGSASTEREAQRLAALLEAARAQARLLDVPVRWRVTGNTFVFDGLAADALPRAWLAEGDMVVTMERPAQAAAQLQLGPEPVIAAQAVLLESREHPGHRWRVATDGLRPFQAQPAGTAVQP